MKILILTFYILAFPLLCSAGDSCPYSEDACKLMRIIRDASIYNYDNIGNLRGYMRIKENIASEEYRTLYKDPYKLYPTIISILENKDIEQYYKGAVIPILFCLEPRDHINFLDSTLIDLYQRNLVTDDVVYSALVEHVMVTDYYVNNYQDQHVANIFRQYINLNIDTKLNDFIYRLLEGKKRKGGIYYSRPLDLCE